MISRRGFLRRAGAAIGAVALAPLIPFIPSPPGLAVLSGGHNVLTYAMLEEGIRKMSVMAYQPVYLICPPSALEAYKALLEPGR